MINKEKLRYDLALNSAVVMTLIDLGKASLTTNPPDRLLSNFLRAYRQYEEPARVSRLNDAVEEINRSE